MKWIVAISCVLSFSTIMSMDIEQDIREHVRVGISHNDAMREGIPVYTLNDHLWVLLAARRTTQAKKSPFSRVRRLLVPSYKSKILSQTLKLDESSQVSMAAALDKNDCAVLCITLEYAGHKNELKPMRVERGRSASVSVPSFPYELTLSVPVETPRVAPIFDPTVDDDHCSIYAGNSDTENQGKAKGGEPDAKRSRAE